MPKCSSEGLLTCELYTAPAMAGRPLLLLGGCTVISLVTAAFFLPETKGKTLEEIEEYFETAKLSPDLQKRGA